MAWAGLKRRRSLRLICEINVAAFAAIMVALFAMFALPGMWPLFGPKTGPPTDWVHVRHARDLRGADRDDAIWIAVERTGVVWLGNQRVRPDQLPAGIQERVKAGSENAVYLSADGRARYGRVREVLQAVQSSGVERVAFLAWKRDEPYPAP